MGFSILIQISLTVTALALTCKFQVNDNLNTQIDDTAQATQSIAKEGAVHAEQKSYQRQAIDAYEVSK
jgi:ABC-type transporter MlaC component